MGGEDDEDDDADDAKNSDGEPSNTGVEKDLASFGTLSSGDKARSKYVDGKNQFAFDPTKFNKK